MNTTLLELTIRFPFWVRQSYIAEYLGRNGSSFGAKEIGIWAITLDAKIPSDSKRFILLARFKDNERQGFYWSWSEFSDVHSLDDGFSRRVGVELGLLNSHDLKEAGNCREHSSSPLPWFFKPVPAED